ncbi:MAG TPA: histidine phosphatase family protein [Candidatus Saccharimonadales bacterium]|nr:histidine phosphatase family protein [Candidatus Saccharimonadales bacterium]
MKTVYFVRHGESEANAAHIWAPSADNPKLTEKGLREAEAAGIEVRNTIRSIDLVITSPLVRAQQTAEIIAKQIAYPVANILVDKRLQERGHGRLAGISQDEVTVEMFNNFSLKKNNQYGVEWIEDIVARTQSFVDDLRQRSEEVILVVGHNGSGRALRRILGGIEPTKPIERFINGEVAQIYPYIKFNNGAPVRL